jgi:NSS family neurotransmitter:Na+ symporter
MAELIIGRHTRANAVTALKSISTGPRSKFLGLAVGFLGMLTVSFILSFYAIVSGWMVAFFFDPITRLLGLESASQWLTLDAVPRNAIFVVVFMLVTAMIVSAGVKDGIERWASRLMPSLIIILILLTIYVMTLPGAMDGVRAYLVPDFSRIADPQLLVDAMGQAFFSLSLGVGAMLVYGSYISEKEDLPFIGTLVALLDVGIAVLAGLLILPAMYVALTNGVEIFDETGVFIAGPGLIVSVLPALFETMGVAGIFVAMAFFVLMTIASLTSSISMLEVPVAYAVEHHGIERHRASLSIAAIITVISLLIVFNFDPLFDLVVTYTTEFSQPMLALFFCVFVAWIWSRNEVLEELKKGCPEVESGLFWKIWPFYVKFVCPVAILLVYFQ